MAQATRSATPAGLSDDPLENASAWFQTNQKPILLSIGAIAAVAVLIWGYRGMESSKREKASQALYQAQAPMAEGRLPQADTALSKVVERYGGTTAGQQAVLLVAQVRYEQGRFPDGVKALEGAVGSASDDFKAAMHELMAAGFEAQNLQEKAAEAYAKASDAAKFPADKAEFKAAQARALMLGGKTAEAKAIWESLATQQEFVFAQEAQIRLGEIAAAASAK